MRRILSFLAIGLSACSGSTPTVKLQVPGAPLDLGEVCPGAKVESQLPITNAGQATGTAEFRVDGGTGFTVDPPRLDIGAGKSGTVTIRYTAGMGATSGPVSAQLHVADGGGAEVSAIALQATVSGRLARAVLELACTSDYPACAPSGSGRVSEAPCCGQVALPADGPYLGRNWVDALLPGFTWVGHEMEIPVVLRNEGCGQLIVDHMSFEPFNVFPPDSHLCSRDDVQVSVPQLPLVLWAGDLADHPLGVQFTVSRECEGHGDLRVVADDPLFDDTDPQVVSTREIQLGVGGVATQLWVVNEGFPDVTVGSCVDGTVALRNFGDQPLTVATMKIAGSDAPDFTIQGVDAVAAKCEGDRHAVQVPFDLGKADIFSCGPDEASVHIHFCPSRQDSNAKLSMAWKGSDAHAIWEGDLRPPPSP